MATRGLALRDSTVQLRTLNRRPGQKDNSEWLRKVKIRAHIARDLQRSNVYLAGCGFGQMFRNVWREKAQYTLALDTNPVKVREFKHHFSHVDVRCADIGTFVDWPRGIKFQIADFDAFGNPYPAMRAFFQNQIWADPVVIVVCDASLLSFKRGGRLPSDLWQRGHEGQYRGLRDAGTYMEFFVWPWWRRLARRHGLAIDERVTAFNRGKTVAYYGIRFSSAL